MCFVIQNHSLMDMCRVYMRKEDDSRLEITNEVTQGFQSRSKVLCCLDEHMLVKEMTSPGMEKLYVVNQITITRLYLPITHTITHISLMLLFLSFLHFLPVESILILDFKVMWTNQFYIFGWINNVYDLWVTYQKNLVKFKHSFENRITSSRC